MTSNPLFISEMMKPPSSLRPPSPPSMPSINSLSSYFSAPGPSADGSILMKYAHAAGTPASHYFMHHNSHPSPPSSLTEDSLSLLKHNMGLAYHNSIEPEGITYDSSPSREFRRGRRTQRMKEPIIAPDYGVSTSSYGSFDTPGMSYATTSKPEALSNHLGSDSFRNTNYYKTPTLDLHRSTRNTVRPSVSTILDPPKERKAMIHSCMLADFQNTGNPDSWRDQQPMIMMSIYKRPCMRKRSSRVVKPKWRRLRRRDPPAYNQYMI